MLQVKVSKNKVNLDEYDISCDVYNRVLLRNISSFDMRVLEEILFSPNSVLVTRLSESLSVSKKDLLSSLKRLAGCDLFDMKGDYVVVNQSKRRYFEVLLKKFKKGFRPGFSFLHLLLRNIDIDLLPGWYQIPRCCDDIFEAILERHAKTPKLYHKHVNDFISTNEFGDIAKMIHYNYDGVSSEEISTKFGLSHEKTQYVLIYLEYNLISTSFYRETDGVYKEYFVPYVEWCDYRKFMNKFQGCDISNGLVKYKEDDFAFINDLSNLIKMNEVDLTYDKDIEMWGPLSSEFFVRDDYPYACRLLTKLVDLALCEVIDGKLSITELGKEWSGLSSVEKSCFLMKNSIKDDQKCFILNKIELALSKIVDSGWFFFEDFCTFSEVPLKRGSIIEIVRRGKNWCYSLPIYSAEEISIVYDIVFGLLFESGIVTLGEIDSRKCFSLTSFGNGLY